MSGIDARRRVAIAGHLDDEATARIGLADVDPKVRSSALGALARLGALDATTLTAACTDEAASVRRRAAQLTAGLAGVDVSGLLADTDPMVVEMAAWACGERVDVDADTFARLCGLAAGHDDALVREAAVAALGAIGDQAALGVVLAATHDKPAVRRRAVIALAAFDGDGVDQALRDALNDRDWQVRQAAEELLSIAAGTDVGTDDIGTDDIGSRQGDGEARDGQAMS